MTDKTNRTFREIYFSLPSRNEMVPPKKEFVRRIAKVTMKTEKTVRCWLAGAQTPDALCQSMIEKELGLPADILFPADNA